VVVPRVLVLVALAGCTGNIDETATEGLSPAAAKAQTAWVQRALPVFKAKCSSCHDGSVAGNPAYLAGKSDLDVRDTLLAFAPPLVNLSAPQSSRVITKGNHEGPALLANEATGILAWITAQRDATPPPPGVEIPQFAPMLCTTLPCPVNTVDLASSGAAGATLTFTATQVNGTADLYLEHITVKAGTGGVHVVHPLFESWPAGAMAATPDPQDRYFSVNVDIMTGMMEFETATTIAGFGSDPLGIRFDTVEMYKPPM
jgi:hypothetical protein